MWPNSRSFGCVSQEPFATGSLPDKSRVRYLSSSYQAAAFADDVPIPDEATNWTADEAAAFFESGGAETPAPRPAVPIKRLLIWYNQWLSTSQQETLAVPAHSRIAAHQAEAVTRVRLFYDSDGAVADPGTLLAISGSWDYRCCLWSVAHQGCSPEMGSDSGAVVDDVTKPELLCELNPSDNRWVYDLAVCGYTVPGPGMPPALAMISTHTGGMAGEPENLIRLWSLRRDEGGSAAVTGNLSQKLNVDGANPSPSSSAGNGTAGHVHSTSHVHLRGVHGVDCSSAHIATISQDTLAVWAFDPARARGQEVKRIPSPLGNSSGSQKLLFLAGGRELVPIGDYAASESKLPILNLDAGLATVDALAMRGGHANAVAELAIDGATDAMRPAALIASNQNRAFIWDRRAGPQPCSRLALPGITAFATLSGEGAGGGPPALLAAAGHNVHIYDIRRLPEESPAAKKAPAAVATLCAPEHDGMRGSSSWTTLAAVRGVVVAGDREGGVCVWDVQAGTSGSAAHDSG